MNRIRGNWDRESCELFEASSDCRLPNFGVVAGGFGINISQTMLSIDRIVAQFRLLTQQNRVRLSILMCTCSSALMFALQPVLTYSSDFNDQIPNCLYPPNHSRQNFADYLNIWMYISIIHLVTNSLIIYYNKYRAMNNLNRFQLEERFRIYENLKTTSAILMLCIFISLCIILYNAIIRVLPKLNLGLTSSQQFLILNLVYAPPYACFYAPVFLVRLMRNTKSERSDSIRTMTKKIDTHDAYVRRMKQMWN
ncbi:unnamed protein product [Caenorhabditis angaria]|uniref:Uncharacterized protein n=1 Tax=Caenorhabditis angaria TaxID=860376 RepID=A0A9P1MW52_9PELO|nr:unnamed protein product [Caenorhabditis angaria]